MVERLGRELMPNIEDQEVSLSAGICVPGEEDTIYQDIVEKADRALYQAKRAGRGCVLAMDPSSSCSRGECMTALEQYHHRQSR